MDMLNGMPQQLSPDMMNGAMPGKTVMPPTMGQPQMQPQMGQMQSQVAMETLLQQMMSGLQEVSQHKKIEPGEDIKLTKEEIGRLGDKVWGKFQFAKNNMNDIRSDWDSIRDAYQSKETTDTGEVEYINSAGQLVSGKNAKNAGVRTPISHVHVPMMVELIDRMVSMNTIRMLQPFQNFIVAKIRRTQMRAYAIEDFLFKMFKSKKMAFEITKAVLNACLFGVGITKVIPDYDSIEPSCFLQAVNLWDFFIDPFATSIEDASFIIHRVYIDADTLQARADQDIFDKQVVKKMLEDKPVRIKDEDIKKEEINSLDAEEIWRGDMREAEADAGDKVGKYDRYTLYEYYDRTHIVTVGDNGEVLRVRRNPIGYPFQAYYLRVPSAGEFWVKGHGEYLLELQHEANIKRNQRLDNMDMLINKPMMYQKGLLDNPEKIVIAGGQKIPIKDLNGYKFLEIEDVTGQTLQEVEYIHQEGERVTAVSPATQGMAVKKEKMTKAETGQVYGQATQPFDFSSSLMAMNGLLPALDLILFICAFIFKGKTAEGIENPFGYGEPVPITPNQMIEPYDFELDINPNKVELDRQQAAAAYQMFSQNTYINQVVLLNFVIPLMFPNAPPNLIMEKPDMTQPLPQNVQLSNNS